MIKNLSTSKPANKKALCKELKRWCLLLDRALGFVKCPTRKWTGPVGNPWAFKKGDRRGNRIGRPGYRASFCKRGHMRTRESVYVGGDCKACIKICRTRWTQDNKARYALIQSSYTKRHPREHYIHTKTNALKRHHRVPPFGQTGIKEFYLACPKSMEVDHIIPLNGRQVSGLHVIWNLQYLSKSDNVRKSNKFVHIPPLCEGLSLSPTQQ